MDWSNYGKTNTFRQQLIKKSPAMIGTVPMYDAIGYLDKDLLEITAKDFLRVVEAHAKEGVDFVTIHAGINRRAVEAFRREGRVGTSTYSMLCTGCVSSCPAAVSPRFFMDLPTPFSSARMVGKKRKTTRSPRIRRRRGNRLLFALAGLFYQQARTI